MTYIADTPSGWRIPCYSSAHSWRSSAAASTRRTPTSSATSSVAASGALVVNFKEAGLGANVTVTEQVTGDGNGQYQWFNKGGNKPQGQPFQADPVAVSGSGSFASGKNGQVTGTIVCEGSVPPPPQDFLDANHASNWVAKLTVTYDNIVLTDTTDGVSITVPDATATVVVLV